MHIIVKIIIIFFNYCIILDITEIKALPFQSLAGDTVSNSLSIEATTSIVSVIADKVIESLDNRKDTSNIYN